MAFLEGFGLSDPTKILTFAIQTDRTGYLEESSQTTSPGFVKLR